MKFTLGIKKNMSQIFNDEGRVCPVTVVTIGDLVVTQVKTKEVDGYDAVQVGFGERNAKNISKPVLGHMKGGSYAYLKEFRLKEPSTLKVGDKVDLTTFKEGEEVQISSISKGKGFQGVIKRHGFKGQPRSHGQKHSERAPGSISGGTRCGGRVPKGMRMAGRMGSDRITIKNLKLVGIDLEKKELLVEGAIPGRRGTLVEIRG
ncbi:MAG: 50S ribosomal protein L3 [bacterium]